MKVDYIVVGCGLAGISIVETIRKANKSFLVIDDDSQRSSVVAAGLYNPVILKRFSEVWLAQEQLEMAIPFYENIEVFLKTKIDYKLRVLRRFSNVEEQNKWFHAADNPKLEPYLSTKLVDNINSYIDAPFGFGEVLQSGRIDTDVLIEKYSKFLKDNSSFIYETFDYNQLIVKKEHITYKHIQAKHIVFCEGFGIKANPFFKNLPLNGTKGEIITIKSAKLKMEFCLKGSVFLIPEGDNLYSVGATYNWDDKTNSPSQSAKEELINKVKLFLKCDFQVVNHKAGIRPTVKDRRPLVGTHSECNNVHILNGLGTRGVMIGPYVARALFNSIENGIKLDSEIDIARFII